MARVTDHRLPGDNCGAESPSLNGEPLARQFIASGIDDLAKYRIVRLLYHYQSLAGDVALFAAYLGFHSLEVTTTLLNELVARGIIVEDRARGRRPRYRLADDGEVRRRLVRLCNATGGSSEWERTLQILAGRSLERARARVLAVVRRARAAHGRERTRPPERSDIAAPGALNAGADTVG